MSPRTIVITGASGGLAQEIIGQLPKEDKIILIGRSKEKLEKRYAKASHISAIGMDIKDSKAIESVLQTLFSEHGSIDVFINNAGFGLFKDYNDFTSDEIEEMFEVNTLVSIHFSRLVAQHMAEQGHGHILNIVSMAGLIASARSTIYSATKFAMIGFSNALRLELADKGVFVTTVNPGPIATHFFDLADPSGDYLKSVGKLTLQPEAVAKKIVSILGKNKRELNLPWLLAVAHKCYTLFPKTSDYLARKVFNFK